MTCVLTHFESGYLTSYNILILFIHHCKALPEQNINMQKYFNNSIIQTILCCHQIPRG